MPARRRSLFLSCVLLEAVGSLRVMHPSEMHAPPPTGRGVYWAFAQDWSGPVKLGAVFIAVVVLGLLPWMVLEMKRLDRSFAAAMAELDTTRFQGPDNRRQAEVRSEGGIDRWSMTVWSVDEQPPRSWSFTAVVDRRANFRVKTTHLEPVVLSPQRGR